MLNSTDHLVKIRAFLGHVTSKFQEMCIPLEHIAINDSFLKQDDTLTFVQFNPIKVHFGIKYHQLHKECKCSEFTWERKLVTKAFCVTKLY